MNIKSITSIFVTGLSINLLFVANAFAYLDPGSGSAILQGILGAIAAIIVVLKLYWHRFLRLLGIRKKPENTIEKAKAKETESK